MHEQQFNTPGVFASNVIWSIAGRVLPIFVTIAAIPILISRLGEDQFGLLLIVVMVIGYFNVLDLGIPRSIIYFLSRPEYDRQRQLDFIKTSTTLLLLISLAGSAVLYLLTEPLVTRWLTIEAIFHDESRRSLYLVAASLPVLTVTTLYRGILERFHAFPVLNRYMIFFGSLNFGLPLLIVWFDPRLSSVVMAMIATRAANGIALFFSSRRYIPELRLAFGLQRTYLLPLVRYSGWITLSNVFIPIISNADRFIIGMLLTMSAVTYYTTPLEVTAKLSVLTFSFVTVLFPTLASLFVADRAKSDQVYHITGKLLLGIGFFSCLNIMLLAEPLLRWYISAEFSAMSYMVLKILCLSLFFNTLAFAPSTYLQSAGLPKATALNSVFIGVLTVILLYTGIRAGGIEGAAWARAGVLLLDTLILTVLTHRLLRISLQWGYVAGAVFSVGVLAVAYLLPSAVSVWLWFLPVQALAVVGFIAVVFTATERGRLRDLLESAWRRITR